MCVVQDSATVEGQSSSGQQMGSQERGCTTEGKLPGPAMLPRTATALRLGCRTDKGLDMFWHAG